MFSPDRREISVLSEQNPCQVGLGATGHDAYGVVAGRTEWRCVSVVALSSLGTGLATSYPALLGTREAA